MKNRKKIGILAIQGSVIEHAEMIRKLGLTPFLVRTKKELNDVDALILPGGESTTIGHIMKKFSIDKDFIKRVKEGMPVYGTCAGAILLAKKLTGTQRTTRFSLMNIEIERNAYGRQVDSFIENIKIPLLGKTPFEAVFIRAPKIKKTGKNVEILAEYRGEPIMCREGNILISTFHPELTKDTRVHKYFLNFLDAKK